MNRVNMDKKLISQIRLLNPWLENPFAPYVQSVDYRQRQQSELMLSSEWDNQWLILVGPRRAGKTTLGKYLASEFVKSGRYKQLLYLNCDFITIRSYLNHPEGVAELVRFFGLERPIIFIDEVQRLETPGLLLKSIADLDPPYKMIASGSSQLEIQSKVREFLTGRQFVVHVLPMSVQELGDDLNCADQVVWGSYPQILASTQKQMQLAQLYTSYIQKDIVEILKVGKPDILQKLVTLIAHSSGQLVNFNQLAVDCGVSIKTIQNYLAILEQTFVLASIKPFVGNKRSEVTSNPIYYFIDNGFRNYALDNFTPLSGRQNAGLLVESFVFQELYKFKVQNFYNYAIHYWRTTSGAEVDFVLKRGVDRCLPIEVKYTNLARPTITRSFRSFLKAYAPPIGIVINKNQVGTLEAEGCTIYFILLDELLSALNLIEKWCHQGEI